MKKRLTIFCYDSDISDIILQYLYSKKILIKIIFKNDKSDPPYVIIESKLEKNKLNKVLASKFYNSYKLE